LASNPRSNTLTIVLGLIISGVFLYFAAKGLHWFEVARALKTANYAWLVPALGVYFVGLYIRAIRWQFLLRHLQYLPVRRLFPVLSIGYMGNNVFPARAGEILRASALKQVSGLPITVGLATVIVERVFDALVMLLLIVCTVSLFASFSGDLPFTLLLVALCVGLIASFNVLASKPAFLVAVFDTLSGRLLPERFRAPVKSFASKFVTGLESVRSLRSVLAVLGLSLAAWLCEATAYLIVSKAFAGMNLSLTHTMMTVAVTSLVMSLPSTPGFVGTFDASCKWAVLQFGVTPALAASFTVVMHLMIWLPSTIVGYAYWIIIMKKGSGQRDSVGPV